MPANNNGNTLRRKKRRSKKQRKYTRKFKNMNCHPRVAGKTVREDSCLTNNVLMQLKDSFNKSHPDKRISTSEPKKIWSDLKRKLKTCNKEDCWLDSIDDPLVRRKIDKQTFAPDHPESWKENPNRWLSNIDIRDVLKQYEETYSEFKLFGPTPIDFDRHLPEEEDNCVNEDICNIQIKEQLDAGKTKLGMVFNLDKYGQGGSHWISMFVDLDEHYIFFMDSAGDKIPPEVDVLVKRIIEQGRMLDTPILFHFHENCPLEHQYEDNECGMYSLYFIITMLTNKTDKKIFKNYVDKIAFFKNKRIPDKYMNRYRKKYFNS